MELFHFLSSEAFHNSLICVFKGIWTVPSQDLSLGVKFSRPVLRLKREFSEMVLVHMSEFWRWCNHPRGLLFILRAAFLPSLCARKCFHRSRRLLKNSRVRYVKVWHKWVACKTRLYKINYPQSIFNWPAVSVSWHTHQGHVKWYSSDVTVIVILYPQFSSSSGLS